MTNLIMTSKEMINNINNLDLMLSSGQITNSLKLSGRIGSARVTVKAMEKCIKQYEALVDKDCSKGILKMSMKQATSEVERNNKALTKIYDKLSECVDFDNLNGIEVSEAIIEEKDNSIKCPRCGSTNIYTDKKGFGIGKAVVGTVLLNPVLGVVGGAMGRKKLEHTCIACNKRFKN